MLVMVTGGAVRVIPKRRGSKAGARVIAAGVVLCAALALAGCSSPVADMPSLDSDVSAAAKPKEPGGYLPVNDVPHDRDAPMISPAERAKIEKELLAARDRQVSASATVKDR